MKSWDERIHQQRYANRIKNVKPTLSILIGMTT